MFIWIDFIVTDIKEGRETYINTSSVIYYNICTKVRF